MQLFLVINFRSNLTLFKHVRFLKRCFKVVTGLQRITYAKIKKFFSAFLYLDFSKLKSKKKNRILSTKSYLKPIKQYTNRFVFLRCVISSKQMKKYFLVQKIYFKSSNFAWCRLFRFSNLKFIWRRLSAPNSLKQGLKLSSSLRK